MKGTLLFALFAVVVSFSFAVLAGSYRAADDTSLPVDVIVHPAGYSGSGGEIVQGVCIDLASENAAVMRAAVERAVATWDALQSTTDTCTNCLGWNEQLPPTTSAYDFESVLVHELGHCVYGINHPDYDSVLGFRTNFTASTHSQFASGPGVDVIRGSRDDDRPIDGSSPPGNSSLFWYNKLAASHNNPTVLNPVVDLTTMVISRDDLVSMQGNNFPASLNVDVGRLLGVGETETVMLGGIPRLAARRDLTPDDVTTVRLGMSGIDGVEGNGDDYTVRPEFHATCSDGDIKVSFDEAVVPIAECDAGLRSQIQGSHYRITPAPPGFGYSVKFRVFFPGTSNPEAWDFGDQPPEIIEDGFESGTFTEWSATVP